MTNDLLQRARDFDCIGHYATSWHDRVEVECDSGCLSQFAAAEIARREAEIADELALTLKQTTGLNRVSNLGRLIYEYIETLRAKL